MLVGALVLCASFWAFRFLSSPPTLTESAKQTLLCIEEQNADCVLDAVSPDEIQSCGLTRTNISMVIRDVIAPALKKLTPGPDIQTQLLTNQGLASRTYRTKTGTEAMFVVDTMSDGSRPRIVFSSLLCSALSLGWVADHPERKSGKELTNGLADELEKNAPLLKSAGVKGIFYLKPIEGEKDFVLLDQYIVLLDQYIANCRATAQAMK